MELNGAEIQGTQFINKFKQCGTLWKVISTETRRGHERESERASGREGDKVRRREGEMSSSIIASFHDIQSAIHKNKPL